MVPMTLVLPMPPSINSIWRSTAKRVMRSEKYRAWRVEAGLALRRQGNAPFIQCDIAVSMKFGPRTRVRDLDNLAKAPLDLLQEHYWIRNDNQVVDLRLRWDDEVRGCQIDLEAAP